LLSSNERAHRGRDVALSLRRTIGESKSSGGSRAELTGGVTVAYQTDPFVWLGHPKCDMQSTDVTQFGTDKIAVEWKDIHARSSKMSLPRQMRPIAKGCPILM